MTAQITGPSPTISSPAPNLRTDWVDAAKGLCIILVVLFHSTLGVEKAIGTQTWMHAVIEWAKPFRMPDFFLISGLFLAARINRPWRAFLDAKVLHFAYFYLLWFHIHYGLRAYGVFRESGAGGVVTQYLTGFVDPFSSLWFIYLLAVFCIVTKAINRQPVWLVALVGLAAHVFAPLTHVFVVDEFFSRFVFFYIGYAFSDYVFGYAGRVAGLSTGVITAGLCLWALANTLGLISGLTEVPGLELVFATLGIGAVIAFSVALMRPSLVDMGGEDATLLGTFLATCGRNSIVVYLAFTLFMATTRALLLKAQAVLGFTLDGGVIALSAATAGLFGALLMHAAVKGTWLAFLFERPAFFRLDRRPLAKTAAAPVPVPPPALKVVPMRAVPPRRMRSRGRAQFGARATPPGPKALHVVV